jgi:hypothetical protein
MPARWTLVTDESAGEAELERFRASGVEVVTVPSRSGRAAASSELAVPVEA